MIEILIILLFIAIFGIMPFQAAREPVVSVAAQSVTADTASPARLSPLPEQFMQQAYPDTVQVWSKHPSAPEPFVYRVTISKRQGQPLAEADYCLEAYSDGLEWRHRVTVLEYRPDFESTAGDLTYDAQIYQRLKDFILREKLQGPISYFSVSDTRFMSPAQGIPAQQLSLTQREHNDGYGFHHQGRYYWFDQAGNPTYAPEHRQ